MISVDRLRRFFRAISRTLSGTQSSGPAPAPVPLPSICVGREALCKTVVDSASNSSCVLLFGGRQAGKTTILRQIATDLATGKRSSRELGRLQLPVFVDLMRLPYDAGPNEFFRLMADRAKRECEASISGFRIRGSSTFDSAPDGLDGFEIRLASLRDSAGQLDLHFLFLVDETKRILRGRFSREFQDNLFALLYGDSPLRGLCQIVFAGAQELYLFSEAGTSPIGSRAEKHFLVGLSEESIRKLFAETCAGDLPTNYDELSRIIYEHSGGHAGLSAELGRRFAADCRHRDFDALRTVATVQTRRSELFQIWVNSFSPEAQLINERLLSAHRLELRDITKHLSDHDFSRYRADRACRELQFTGIANYASDVLEESNPMYSSYARQYGAWWQEEQKGNDAEHEVWQLIKETELRLRKVVRKSFDGRWKGKADDKIKALLGEKAWTEIIKLRDAYSKRYTRPGFVATTDVLDFTYLGQLGQLILANDAWDMFKPLFVDKRQLQEILRDITPVRSDSAAHFRTVPERELTLCKIRCSDLCGILEKLPLDPEEEPS